MVGGILVLEGSVKDPSTFPQTNIAPENSWLEDEFPFGMASFQRRLVLVSGSVIILFGGQHAWHGPTA